MAEYASDPEVLAWARGEVQQFVERVRLIAEQASEDDAPKWRGIAVMLEVEVVGTGGPQIAVFDERRPAIEAELTRV